MGLDVGYTAAQFATALGEALAAGVAVGLLMVFLTLAYGRS